MTLWARLSYFREQAELLDGEWTVSIEEHPDEVVFKLTLQSECVIDLESLPRSLCGEYLTGVGQDSSELILDSDPRIEVTVPKDRLPNDYRD